MYLVNSFGRVVEVEDELAASRIKSGRFREATDSEVAARLNERRSKEEAPGGSDVYYQTVTNSPDGYGVTQALLAGRLYEQGVKMAQVFEGQKVGLLYNYPSGVLSMRSDVRLIYTMFESDKLPEDWSEYLKAADEVLVPSKWCHDVFKNSGITTTVVPLGYDERIFTFTERPLPIRQNEPFTFIHYDSFNMRKGFAEVFKAFTEEFTPSEPVRLILKTVHSQPPVPILKSQYPNIEVISGHVAPQELAALLGRAHCLVYPSRGEGFGLTPLEAMATGLLAIVPNAHGISEYFNPNYMIEVAAPDRCPALYSKFKGEDVGQMVVCSVDDLKARMRWAVNWQQEAHDIGRAAADYVKNYTITRTAERLAEIIKRWQAAEVVKRGDSKYLQVEQV